MIGDAAEPRWELLGPLIVIMAAALTAGLIVALHPLLERYALARPTARSSHVAPTPQGGGMAVTAALIGIVALVMLGLPQLGADSAARLAPVLAAAALMACVGAVDDIRGIGVGPRLLLQTLAVGAAIAALPDELRVAPLLPWWVERVVLVLGGLWFVNLVNFMDGIDWMTVAETIPLACGIVVIAAVGVLPSHALVVALALLGAMLGFAPFNRPVARLFLGDVGSLPIGIVLGWLLALVAGSGHLAAALLLPLYYLADATVTLLRRLRNGERVWQAHRTHFYQRATDRGFSVLAVVGRVFAVNIGLAALAVLSVARPSWATSGLSLAIGVALVAWLLVAFARGRTHQRRPA